MLERRGMTVKYTPPLLYDQLQKGRGGGGGGCVPEYGEPQLNC